MVDKGNLLSFCLVSPEDLGRGEGVHGEQQGGGHCQPGPGQGGHHCQNSGTGDHGRKYSSIHPLHKICFLKDKYLTNATYLLGC